ncbi:pilus assembly protein TadG-related protein [Streptomyces acidiscabies]|uniref:pilus assembly protein TadG-related protein n=1 Tax=Streptomyces acidiscabies TaxID=42234 RepID=UPI0038F6BAD6
MSRSPVRAKPTAVRQLTPARETPSLGSATRRRPTGDAGQVTPFVVILTTAVVMFAGLLLDGGLALAAKTRALGEAQEAARAGAQALDLTAYRADGTVRLDPAQARTLARTYLATTKDTGTATATTTTVTVTVTAHQPAQLLRFLGLDTLTVTATGTAHPVHGITTPDP